MLLSLLLHGDAAASTGFLGLDAAHFHAIFNDFPPALLVVGVGFELAYLFTRRESLRHAAFWSLVVGAVLTANAVATGLKAEDSIQHGQAIHEIMEVHERFAWITLGFFAVIAAWLLLREKKMGWRERWTMALVGVIGLGFLVATGREGGKLVFEHAAGMSTEAMEAEIRNREGGHEHAPGEEHDHGEAPPAAADSTGDSATAATPAHTHAPGTPPHKD
ncbi:MAG TPA: DUF2231 domain-containing protein [Gemmatimonadales bacterium]|nr:DUF2231 domain-containing protein [Gemmatimonadales bacterium]